MVSRRSEGRIRAIEQRVAPPCCDPRELEEAHTRFVHLLDGALRSLAAGNPACNAMERALVAHGGDIEAALRDVIDAPRHSI
jgi:hypothetical protein